MVNKMENENISQLKAKFIKEYRKMSDEEIEKFDIKFVEKIEPLFSDFYESFSDFYDDYNPTSRGGRGKKAYEKRERYLDYIYMYMIAHDKDYFDERYDQPIFAAAKRYAEGK